MKIILKALMILFSSSNLSAQNPVFGNEIPVTINNYTLDAMEPFISPDGNAIFFNSLNDGNTTSIYYAGKVNDSTFNLVGLLPVVNQTVVPRLDGVASIDTANNFYWVSTRGYPSNYDNLHRVRFLQTGYTNFGRVHGNIYINNPGWIIMDAAINYTGDKMAYCNAWFNNCSFGMPCISALALAQKVNDSTFNKFPNSGTILANLNDTSNYLVYAPQLSSDELEIYYTRALKNIPQTEICVAVRSGTNLAFGPPAIIIPSSGTVPEGPTLTTDKSKLYYHRKVASQFKIYFRKRSTVTQLPEWTSHAESRVYPNPNKGIFYVGDKVEKYTIYDYQGKPVDAGNSGKVDLTGLPEGIYFARIFTAAGIHVEKVLIVRN